MQQRRWTVAPDWGTRWRKGFRTLLYANFNLGLTLALAFLGLVPPLTPLAYAFAVLHFAYGIAVPRVHVRPTRVGIEQSLATLAFFLILALAFRM